MQTHKFIVVQCFQHLRPLPNLDWDFHDIPRNTAPCGFTSSPHQLVIFQDHNEPLHMRFYKITAQTYCFQGAQRT